MGPYVCTLKENMLFSILLTLIVKLLLRLFFCIVLTNFIITKCGNYSRAESIQGRKLLIIRRFWPRKVFKGGNYSRAETIRGNTVGISLLYTTQIFRLSALNLEIVANSNTVFPRIGSALEYFPPLNTFRSQTLLIINSFLPWIIAERFQFFT